MGQYFKVGGTLPSDRTNVRVGVLSQYYATAAIKITATIRQQQQKTRLKSGWG